MPWTVQVSYYFRPDRYVVTFADIALSTNNTTFTFQLELFWKAGTLAPGSMRITWLDINMQDALAGLMLTNQSAAPRGGAISSVVWRICELLNDECMGDMIVCRVANALLAACFWKWRIMKYALCVGLGVVTDRASI